eukprot:g9244.t1
MEDDNNQRSYQTAEEESFMEEQNYIPKHHSHKFDIVKRKYHNTIASSSFLQRRNNQYDDETLIVSRTIEGKTSPTRKLDNFKMSSLDIFNDIMNPMEHGKPRKLAIYKNSLALCDIIFSDYVSKNSMHPFLLINEHAKIDDTLTHIFMLRMGWDDTVAAIVRAGYYLFDINYKTFSKFNIVNMQKIWNKCKINTDAIPNHIFCEDIFDHSKEQLSVVSHLGRKYEIFGGKNLPFLQCKKHHRLLDKVFVSGLTTSGNCIGLTDEYVVLGANKSPIMQLEGLLCNIDGKICNLDPRLSINEVNGKHVNNGYSITLTTASRQNKRKLFGSKKHRPSLFIDFVSNYLMDDEIDYNTIKKKLKTRHVKLVGNRIKASTILEYLSGSELLCVS